jgi:hypothetical protein
VQWLHSDGEKQMFGWEEQVPRRRKSDYSTDKALAGYNKTHSTYRAYRFSGKQRKWLIMKGLSARTLGAIAHDGGWHGCRW